MRSRAFVGWLLFDASRSTLKYARQVFDPCPTAAARRWHVASAPARPPIFPVTLVALDTKNVIPVCVLGLVTRSSSPHAGVRNSRARNSLRFIGLSPFNAYLNDLLTTSHTTERLNHAKVELD